jgi:hypothetical protein
MAKRTRGTGRPGQRRPITRATRPVARTTAPANGSAAAPAVGLTAAEEARAAEYEAQIAAAEQAAPARTAERRPVAGRPNELAAQATRRRSSGGLAVQYAHEYDYVARDLRRILVTASLLTAILFGIWFLFEVVGLSPL